jgi:hypothetical protein
MVLVSSPSGDRTPMPVTATLLFALDITLRRGKFQLDIFTTISAYLQGGFRLTGGEFCKYN